MEQRLTLTSPKAMRASRATSSRRFLRLRASDIQAYNFCELVSELLLYFMVIFSPWAFGTTQPWSIWTMNITGYLLGLLLALRLGLRRLKSYHPPGWDEAEDLRRATMGSNEKGARSRLLTKRRMTVLLGTITALLLGYCLVSAVNARATYHEDTLAFEYRPCISWLPHSFDQPASWAAFWRYLGLACAFWAIVDWLPGKSRQEQRAEWQRPTTPIVAADVRRRRKWGAPSPCLRTSAATARRQIVLSMKCSGSSVTPSVAPPILPARLRRLLWLLSINGAVLSAEATLQRLADSPRLLFLVLPRIHQAAISQFGPFAYRANAAQYLNLLWPVCLGFWLTLNRGAAASPKTRRGLLVCAALIAAGPLISTSRGGALITLLMIVLGGLFLLGSGICNATGRQKERQARHKSFFALGMFFAAVIVLGGSLGWRALAPRLEQMDEGFTGRNLMYEAARPIAHEFPLYGTGPGTFETVSYFYPRPDIYWPPQLHNDWLETRITFGLVGSTLIALALLTIGLRWWARGGIRGGRRFVALTWLALGGCLLHARFDFPFQVYSVLLLVLVLCAILFTLCRRTL